MKKKKLKKTDKTSVGNQVSWIVKEPKNGKSTLSHKEEAKNQSNVPTTYKLTVEKSKITGSTVTSILPARSDM